MRDLALDLFICKTKSYQEPGVIKSKIKIRSKYVPAGIKILYEDRDIIVIDKSSGLLSVKARYETEKTAHQLLINYVRNLIIDTFYH